jgi:hypothetical protein
MQQSSKKITTSRRGSTTQPDLAHLLATALKHPELPYLLRDKLMDGLVELASDDAVYEDAGTIRAVLNVGKEARRKSVKRGSNA